MIMTTRKLMRFMPEADKLDGNIWAWIVPVWDVFSEFKMIRYHSVKEKILVYSFGYKYKVLDPEFLARIPEPPLEMLHRKELNNIF